MTEKEIIEKTEKYDKHHYYWRDKVFNQLGYSINLFLTFGIAILGYLVSQKKAYIDSSLSSYIEALYYLTIILSLLSVLFGCISVTSRMFDLKITSHTAKMRKKTLKILKGLLPDDFKYDKKNEPFKIYRKLIWTGFHGLKDNEYNDILVVKNKFDEFRDITRQLGTFTWKIHIWQIISLIITILFYVIIFIVK